MTSSQRASLTIGNRRFDWGSRTYVMGVINLSPESFSGDGLTSVAAAVEQARRFAAEGADLLDVGGMSTRPGFEELSMDDELQRVIPALEAITTAATDLPVSIDTYRAVVAAAALDAGASLLNDITGLHLDAAMAPLIAQRAVPAILMHNQRGRAFHDVIEDIRAGLDESLALAEAAGISHDHIIIDPGFGFGWTPAQNLEMLRRLAELRDLGLPLLVGTSRKSTIGAVLDDAPPDQRIYGTAATVAIAIANGADIIRVHDVAAMVQVAHMTDAIVRKEP